MTAPGSAALTIFRVPRGAIPEGVRLFGRDGRARAWPSAGRWALGHLMHAERRLDEVVVLGRSDALEIHAHGAERLARELEQVLRVVPAQAPILECAAATRSLRGVRALASAQRGPLAQLFGQWRQRQHGDRFPQGWERARALLPFGAYLLRPPKVRLVGLPNAGKSTLFNRLSGETRALVSDQAGTTRDTVTQELQVCGVPIQLEDAAGSAAATTVSDGADLLVHLLSSEQEEPLSGTTLCLRVLGRADEREPGELPRVSGASGEGVPELLTAVGASLGLNRPSEDDSWTPLLPLHRALLAESALG
ncbi:MAG: hypothetical protein DHS20C15_22300 [Planctomycetota bacterium]|nr:MAG: hypothetical protein DHS20C15_22300 [Planctomycetota bacterium]